MSIAQRIFIWIGVVLGIYLLNVTNNKVVSVYVVSYFVFIKLWIELSPWKRFIRLNQLIRNIAIEDNSINNRFYWTAKDMRNDWSKTKRGSSEFKQFHELQQSLLNKTPEQLKLRYEKLFFNQIIDETGTILAIADKDWHVSSHWQYPMYLWPIPEELREKYQMTLDNFENKKKKQFQRQSDKSFVTNIGWCPKCHNKLNNIFVSKCPYCTNDLG
jgi:hypothetical protein